MTESLPGAGLLPTFFDPAVTGLGRLPMGAPLSRRGQSSNSLNGTWRFRLFSSLADLFDASPDHESDPAWRSIEVPGCWTRQNTGDLPQYTNVIMPWDQQPPNVPAENPTGLYRTTFCRLEADRTIIEFGGAESMLLVWCNGNFVGMGKDSRLSSSFDLSSYVIDGDNELAVAVCRWSDATWIEDQDHWFHGGLHRSVTLIGTAATRIDDVVTNADFDPTSATGSLQVQVLVGSESRLPPGWSASLTLHLPDQPSLTVEAAVAHPPPAEGSDAMAGAYSFLGPVAELSFSDLMIAPWSAESPSLYPFEVHLLDPDGQTTETVEGRVGFRRVEVVDRRLLVNGNPILVAGVNRHDHHPDTGKTISKAEMRHELISMKQHNINAVRTSHYPNDPDLLDLCDELGLYVVDEANVESHARHDSLAVSRLFDQAIFDRVRRMVLRDRSHPSIIGWSLGNESGHGAVHDAAAAWIRRIDSTRFVQYEGGQHFQWNPTSPIEIRHVPPSRTDRLVSDMVCPMYATVDQISAWAQWAEETEEDDRPLVLCEYSHAMGNSNGDLADYWEAFLSQPALGGGFVWDWRDQGLTETTSDGQHWWAYGGHYGDEPNDANFCINGLVGPDGLPHPGLRELAWLARPVAIGYRRSEVTIENRYQQINLDHLRVRWELSRDGIIAEQGTLDLPTIQNGTTATVPLALRDDLEPPSYLTALNFFVELASDTSWASAGHRVGHDQVILADARRTGAPAPADTTIEARADRPERSNMIDAIVAELRPTLWRAPTDNDGVGQGWTAAFTGIRAKWLKWGLDDLPLSETSVVERALEDRREIERHHTLGAAEHRSVASLFTHGSVRIEEEMTIPDEWFDVPRLGVMFSLGTEFTRLRWLGPGPDETYPDRRAGSIIDLWESSVADQYHAFVVPQDHGIHVDCSWFELLNDSGSGIRVIGDPTVTFAARHHSDEALTKASTLAQLQPSDHVEVHVDHAVRGLGTGACGPDTTATIGPGVHRWSWWLVPVQGPPA